MRQSSLKQNSSAAPLNVSQTPLALEQLNTCMHLRPIHTKHFT